MTRDEVGQVVLVVDALWPHSNLGDDPQATATVWHSLLEPYAFDEVKAALMRLARGREHAPPVGVLVQAVAEDRQGDAPSFDDAMAILGRHTRCLPYQASGINPPEDLVVALDALQAAGVPEVVQRFVAAVGVYAIRAMPDASRFPLDPNQRAVRRDASRFYGEKVVPAWKTDPTPGLALRKAEKRFGPVPKERRLRPQEHRKTLTPWIDNTAQDPPVDPAQVRQLLAGQEIKKL